MKAEQHSIKNPNPDKTRTLGVRSFLSLVVSLAFALAAQPARAQVPAGSQEIHLYGGALFGDDLTDEISGRTPKLKDSFTFGGRYAYNVTPEWGVEFSLGHTLGKAKETPAGDIDLRVTTLEAAAIRHFTMASNPSVIPYLTLGVGASFANLDQTIAGTHNGQNVSLGDKDGFTASFGGGWKYMLTSTTMLRLDVRYRYLDKLVSPFDSSLNTLETTVGIGWRF